MPMCPIFNYPSHPLSLGYSEMPTNEPWENFKGLDAPFVKTQWKELCTSSGCKTWLEIGWGQNFPWGFSILKSLNDFVHLIRELLPCCQILPYRFWALLSRCKTPTLQIHFWILQIGLVLFSLGHLKADHLFWSGGSELPGVSGVFPKCHPR